MRGHNKRAYWANERLGLWFTVRKLQQKSMAIAVTGDTDAMMAHAQHMFPLISRAHDLGVDIHHPSFRLKEIRPTNVTTSSESHVLSP